MASTVSSLLPSSPMTPDSSALRNLPTLNGSSPRVDLASAESIRADTACVLCKQVRARFFLSFPQPYHKQCVTIPLTHNTHKTRTFLTKETSAQDQKKRGDFIFFLRTLRSKSLVVCMFIAGTRTNPSYISREHSRYLMS